jgi:5-methylcytosine-specific restriction enzyme subunit McrC
LQKNILYDKISFHSGNLCQIFSYVKNKDTHHSGNVSGLLLYAKTDDEITPNASYIMDGNRISIKTLDLDKDFTGITQQLDKIIEEWLG